MAFINTRLVLPGSYGVVVTENDVRRNLGSQSIGLVGPANGGTLLTPQSFTSPQIAADALGNCAALDLANTIWANGGGEIVFVRVGGTKVFDEVYQDEVGGAATDLTTGLSRLYGSDIIFDTGALDYVYVGSESKFASIYVDVLSAAEFSSGSVAMSAEYYDGSSWASLVITDETVSGSKTLGQTGTMTFTEPSDWEQISAPIAGGGAGFLYWVRFRPAEVPTGAPVVRMITKRLNALPAYAVISEIQEVTGDLTSNETNTYAITAVNIGADKFTIAGDKVSFFPVGSQFTVSGSTGNNGTWTVESRTLNGGDTEIVAVEDVTNAVADGNINTICIPGKTIFNDSTGSFLSDGIDVGDVVTNESDGSTAEVVSVDSDTKITTTALEGGTLNRYRFGGTVVASGSTVPDPLADNKSVSAVSSVTGGSLLTVAAVDFVAARVAVGDKVKNNTDASSGVVVSVVSANKIIVSGGTWAPADSIDVWSTKVLQDVSHNFAKNGVRPGTIIDFGANGSTTVLSLLDHDEDTDTCYTLLTDGLSGGTGAYFEPTFQYGYVVAPDTYSIATPVEKAYLEAAEWGTNGNGIAVEVAKVGTDIRLKLTKGNTEEIYKTPSSDTQPLLTFITEITEKSQLVAVAEDLTSGVYDIPDTFAKTFFTGGTNGSASDDDYAEGLDALLENKDVKIVLCTTYNDAINAALKAHVGTAATINYQSWREAICAKPENETVSAVTTALRDEAEDLAYDGRITYVIQDATIRSGVSSTGLSRSRAAFAAAYAGALAKQQPAYPMTGRTLNVAAISPTFNRADRTNLVEWGILIADQTANGIEIVRGVTTTTDEGNPYYEVSFRRAVDVTEVTVREQLYELYKNSVNVPSILDQIKASTEGILSSLTAKPGTTGTLRAWRNVRVEFNSGDKTRVDVSYEVLVLSPINFITTFMLVKSGVSFD